MEETKLVGQPTAIFGRFAVRTTPDLARAVRAGAVREEQIASLRSAWQRAGLKDQTLASAFAELDRFQGDARKLAVIEAAVATLLEDRSRSDYWNQAIPHAVGVLRFAPSEDVSVELLETLARRSGSSAQVYVGGGSDSVPRRSRRATMLASAETSGALWRSGERSAEQTAILVRVEQLVRDTAIPVVVFDLDDCLLTTGARQVRIWREYGELHGIEQLKNMQVGQITSWNLKDVFVGNLGLDPAWFETHQADLRAFWSERFFSNEYAAEDTSLPGAPEYLQILSFLGAHIVYISGRSEEEMGEGTREALRRNRFPIDGPKVTLILKNKSNKAIWAEGTTEEARIDAQRQADVQFKKGAIARAKALGTVVASFDNEPTNVNQYYAEFHLWGVGLAIRVETSQAKQLPLHRDAVSIQGFLR